MHSSSLMFTDVNDAITALFIFQAVNVLFVALSFWFTGNVKTRVKALEEAQELPSLPKYIP